MLWTMKLHKMKKVWEWWSIKVLEEHIECKIRSCVAECIEKKNKTEDCHIINFHAGIYLWVLSQILYFHPPSNFKIYNMTGL